MIVWLNSAVLTSLTLTELSTFFSNIKTLAVFLLASCLLAFAAFLHLSQLHSQLKSYLEFLSCLVKSPWVPCQSV